MKKLTASLEDYLEIICNYNDNNKKIRAVDISKELNITRPSVTEALKRLEEKGFVNYGRYDTIRLTDLGRDLAQNIISKHNTLEIFFEKFLNLSKEEASINACKIEHVITDNAFSKIKEFISKEVQ